MIDTSDNTVTVCMDYIKSRCSREKCKYFHPPTHLQAKIKAAQHQANQTAVAAQAAAAAAMVRHTHTHTIMYSYTYAQTDIYAPGQLHTCSARTHKYTHTHAHKAINTHLCLK